MARARLGGAVDAYDADVRFRARGPMPLHLQELLDDPGLGLALVAGQAGAARDNPIRWAHISDTPDPTPWLEGGEVLLTTGLGVKDDPDAQRRLVRGLTERGCVGIGFGVGVSIADVPTAMVEEADALGMPLFTVPFEVPFIAVTRRVARAVFYEHFATLRSAVDLHRKVLGTVIAGGGVGAVLEAVGDHLTGADLLVYDFSGRLLARHATGHDLDAGDLWTRLAAAHADRDRTSGRHGELVVTSVVARSGDEVQAVLAVVNDRELHEHEHLLVEQALAGISLDLARGQSVREGRRVRVDELLEEVAAGRAGTHMIARVLARLGSDPAAAYRVLCLRRPADVTEQALCTQVEDVLAARGVPTVVGRYDGDVFAVVPGGDDELVIPVTEALSTRGWVTARVGRSLRHDDLDAFQAAVREARTAAHSPTGPGQMVQDVESIGLEGMLAPLRDGVVTGRFVEQVLGPVIGYDERESSQLVATLRAYLRHGCRPGPAAEELSIHRHTLAYRLDRFTELAGRDPRDGANLLELTLALELLDGGRP